jgi:hypothetical protein
LESLRELLARDLSTVGSERLLDGVREAELLFDQAQVWCGLLIAELRRRPDGARGEPRSWAELAQLTGIAPTTLRNRAAKAEDQ